MHTLTLEEKLDSINLTETQIRMFHAIIGEEFPELVDTTVYRTMRPMRSNDSKWRVLP